MSETRHTLDELQRWIQAVVTHPHGVLAGIDSDLARDQIVVVPDQAERVVSQVASADCRSSGSRSITNRILPGFLNACATNIPFWHPHWVRSCSMRSRWGTWNRIPRRVTRWNGWARLFPSIWRQPAQRATRDRAGTLTRRALTGPIS